MKLQPYLPGTLPRKTQASQNTFPVSTPRADLLRFAASSFDDSSWEKIKAQLQDKYTEDDLLDGFFDELSKRWEDNPGFWKRAGIVTEVGNNAIAAFNVMWLELFKPIVLRQNPDILDEDDPPPLSAFVVSPSSFDRADKAIEAFEEANALLKGNFYAAFSYRLTFAHETRLQQKQSAEEFNRIHGKWISKLVYCIASLPEESGWFNIAASAQKDLLKTFGKTVPDASWKNILTRMAVDLPRDKQVSSIRQVLNRFALELNPVIPKEQTLAFLQEQYQARTEQSEKQAITRLINHVKVQFPGQGQQQIEQWFRQQGRIETGGHRTLTQKEELKQAFSQSAPSESNTGTQIYQQAAEYLSHNATHKSNPVFVLFLSSNASEQPLDKAIQTYVLNQNPPVSEWKPKSEAEPSEWKRVKAYTEFLKELSQETGTVVVSLPLDYPHLAAFLNTLARYEQNPVFKKGGEPIDLSKLTVILKVQGTPQQLQEQLQSQAKENGTQNEALEGYNSLLSRAGGGRILDA